jgi:archaellum component FlaF (FlaF/FlaG flagellin family)
VVKSLSVHNYHASDTVTVTITHNNGTADFEVDEMDVSATDTTTRQDVKVFQSGDKLKVTANAANKAMVSVSLLEIKQQQ